MPRYSRRRSVEPLHIYTDGCALRNGQPGAKGGWAIVYELGDFQDDYGYCTDDPQTNNRFELEAIGQALERSLDSGGEYDITIFTDSKYAINSIKHWIKKWKQNGWRNSQGKRVHNDLLIQDIDCMLEDINYAGGSVEFEYVEAHSGNWFNEKADRLAKKAAFKNPLYSNYDFNYRK
ncbi:hypothetical protein CAEBREN_20592 [Caenorhabditis brenneri]|uniref:RNase H type-1 domain-containing protein n=1 Tax=Caenorhabditis brenneri TaxID=135651 RepID=G0PGA5_CAEBE|nr:hypothetical protein CAEBREN_20592 [Caenorhabditis brenneri]